jgi:hydrogenase small subunit
MPTLLWMECGACSGESMAILGAEGPGKNDHNLLEFLETNNVDLLWHPSLSLESPRQIRSMIDRIIAGEQALTLFCVEGSIIQAPNGTGMFDTFLGEPKKDIVKALCAKADFVFAMGACSAWGGIPAAPPNPSDSTGLQYFPNGPGGLLGSEWRSKAGLPVINVAGCPADAATMLRTLSRVLHGEPLELDSYNRPATVQPCLSDVTSKKCGTAAKVGYSCYGCISPRFPNPKLLFRHADGAPKQRTGKVATRKLLLKKTNSLKNTNSLLKKTNKLH